MSDAAPPEVLDRIRKLLNLAARNTSEAEAASAAAKAQELLLEYNLTADGIGTETGSGAREAALVTGGYYAYQRELWTEVAELNFCLYWNQQRWNNAKRNRNGTKGAYERQHRLVGKRVNVAATRATATYLEGAVARLVKDRLGTSTNVLTSWANSYRAGVVASICRKLRERRNEAVAAEEERFAAAARATDNPGTSTVLTIVRLRNAEYDANIDHEFGAGTAAKWAEERAERARINRLDVEAYTKWAAENPKEAAERAARRKRQSTDRGGPSDRSAYWAGYDDGKRVSIDPQVDRTRNAGLIR